MVSQFILKVYRYSELIALLCQFDVHFVSLMCRFACWYAHLAGWSPEGLYLYLCTLRPLFFKWLGVLITLSGRLLQVGSNWYFWLPSWFDPRQHQWVVLSFLSLHFILMAAKKLGGDNWSLHWRSCFRVLVVCYCQLFSFVTVVLSCTSSFCRPCSLFIRLSRPICSGVVVSFLGQEIEGAIALFLFLHFGSCEVLLIYIWKSNPCWKYPSCSTVKLLMMFFDTYTLIHFGSQSILEIAKLFGIWIVDMIHSSFGKLTSRIQN